MENTMEHQTKNSAEIQRVLAEAVLQEFERAINENEEFSQAMKEKVQNLHYDPKPMKESEPESIPGEIKTTFFFRLSVLLGQLKGINNRNRKTHQDFSEII